MSMYKASSNTPTTIISTRLVMPPVNKAYRRVSNLFKLQADLEIREDPLSSLNKPFLDQALEMTTRVITSHLVEGEGHKILKMNPIWV